MTAGQSMRLMRPPGRTWARSRLTHPGDQRPHAARVAVDLNPPVPAAVPASRSVTRPRYARGVGVVGGAGGDPPFRFAHAPSPACVGGVRRVAALALRLRTDRSASSLRYAS